MSSEHSSAGWRGMAMVGNDARLAQQLMATGRCFCSGTGPYWCPPVESAMGSRTSASCGRRQQALLVAMWRLQLNTG